MTITAAGPRLHHPVSPPSAPEDSSSDAWMDAIAANRITIEEVYPEVDGGRFPVKRVVGDVMEVWADVYTDGTFVLGAAVLFRAADEEAWSEVPMTLVDNDRWVGHVPLTRNTMVTYTVAAWRDVWESWRADVKKKVGAGLDVTLEVVEGRRFIEQAARQNQGDARRRLEDVVARFHALDGAEVIAYALSDEPRATMKDHGERAYLSRYPRDLQVFVDRRAARFSSWFEIFPRSASSDPGRPGTLRDVIGLLPMVRDMGFDVLYFPPIHPIGRCNRKGANNTLNAGPGDPGVPYAIGAEEGGHDAIDPMIGTLDDFRALVVAARGHGIEIALDFAVQCSPDHPWIRAHPQWFYWRPDGSIRYAENPPKKYQDIVNVSFYRQSYPDLWFALRDVVLFWCAEGVRIFRVDNPHTKPFPFWEWLIAEVRERYPDAIFLAEAFTRPKLMRRLAKLGFSQSYSYFTWRNGKGELTEYLWELTHGPSKDYMLPNFFPSTPDILPPAISHGGRGAHMARAVLAGTLSPSYGLYTPYLLCEADPHPGKEEYNHSEKYQIRHWDWDRPGNIRGYIARLNAIRHDNPALQHFTNLLFLNAWNDAMLAYAKLTPDRSNVVVAVVNLDPYNAQECGFEVPLWELGLPDDASVAVEDLWSGYRFVWTGKVQHVRLDPYSNPAGLWRVARMG